MGRGRGGRRGREEGGSGISMVTPNQHPRTQQLAKQRTNSMAPRAVVVVDALRANSNISIDATAASDAPNESRKQFESVRRAIASIVAQEGSLTRSSRKPQSSLQTWSFEHSSSPHGPRLPSHQTPSAPGSLPEGGAAGFHEKGILSVNRKGRFWRPMASEPFESKKRMLATPTKRSFAPHNTITCGRLRTPVH